MTYLRDVIDIPERVTASDFVVGLAEGVAHKAETLATYVVTPQLAECFDKALGLVAGAVQDRRSKAAFLHGSFGSGKSHFMAVLHQLLQARPRRARRARARARRGQARPGAAGQADPAATFHMIGAESLEAAVLGGYVTQIRARHPDAPLPAVHRSDDLVANADQQRTLLGDEKFFATLNERPATSGGFGGIGRRGRRRRPPARGTTRRTRPPGTPRTATRSATGWSATWSAPCSPRSPPAPSYVDLDTGLAVHLPARRRPRLRRRGALPRRADPLARLPPRQPRVRHQRGRQAGQAGRVAGRRAASIPLVSLIARQRDITEFLGTHVPGAEQAAFADVFGWSRGRFDDIRLEDRNLPVIAERRLLKPKDDAARQVLDDAFAAGRPAPRGVGRAAHRRPGRGRRHRLRPGGLPADLPVQPRAGRHPGRALARRCSASAPRSR